MSVSIGGTTGVTFSDASVQNTAATGFGFKNRIINGAMMIAQRGTSTVLSVNVNGFSPDRFKSYFTSSGAAVTISQSSTAPSGFVNSYLYTVTTGAALGATDFNSVSQLIEGANIADLGWGAAGASAITISFWVRSSITGTYGVTLRNVDGTVGYGATYTISAANTFEYKTITIPGCTTGTWNTSNGIGIQLTFGLGVGSTYSGAAGSWGTGYWGVTGATNIVATTGATFYITGVQLEKGSTATSFDYRPYGTELALCQRYYWKIYSSGGNSPIASGNAESTTRGYFNLTLPQPMRTQPSCSVSNQTHFALRGVGTDVATTTGNFGASTSSAMATIIGGEWNTASATGASAGGCVKFSWNNASAWIDASAEL